MNPLDAFDRILASLHQATLDDAHWPVTAALVDEAVGATGNSLTVSERFGDDVRVCFTGLYRRGDRRQDLEHLYFGVNYAHDERRPRLISAAAGQLIHAPDLYTPKELKTSPAYNEGARILGTQNGLNVRFDGPGGLAGLLDNNRTGAIHLDRRGRIVETNARALALLRRGEGLCDRDDTLGAWLPADHGHLQRLIRKALPTFGARRRRPVR